jgi:hypothetical protein
MSDPVTWPVTGPDPIAALKAHIEKQDATILEWAKVTATMAETLISHKSELHDLRRRVIALEFEIQGEN